MDNIINFQDKKKKKPEEPTSKDDMLKILDDLKNRVEQGIISGIAAVGMGDENKIYSIITGEFDIILAVGGLETLKQYLIIHTSTDEDE